MMHDRLLEKEGKRNKDFLLLKILAICSIKCVEIVWCDTPFNMKYDTDTAQLFSVR